MNANEQFEALAALYYRRYRRLAPGKYEAPEIGRDSNDPENRAQWMEWFSKHALFDAIERMVSLEQALDSTLEVLGDVAENTVSLEWRAKVYAVIEKAVNIDKATR